MHTFALALVAAHATAGPRRTAMMRTIIFIYHSLWQTGRRTAGSSLSEFDLQCNHVRNIEFVILL